MRTFQHLFTFVLVICCLACGVEDDVHLSTADSTASARPVINVEQNDSARLLHSEPHFKLDTVAPPSDIVPPDFSSLALDEVFVMPFSIEAPVQIDAPDEPPTHFVVFNDSLLVLQQQGTLHVINFTASIHRQLELPCEMNAAFIEKISSNKLLLNHYSSIAVTPLNNLQPELHCDVGCTLYDAAVDVNGAMYFFAHIPGRKSTERGYADELRRIAVIEPGAGFALPFEFRRFASGGNSIYASLNVDDNSLFFLDFACLTTIEKSSWDHKVYNLEKLVSRVWFPMQALGRVNENYVIFMSRNDTVQDAILMFNTNFNDIAIYQFGFKTEAQLRSDVGNYGYMSEWPGGVMYYLDPAINKLYALGFSTGGECVLLSCGLPEFYDESGATIKGRIH